MRCGARRTVVGSVRTVVSTSRVLCHFFFFFVGGCRSLFWLAAELRTGSTLRRGPGRDRREPCAKYKNDRMTYSACVVATAFLLSTTAHSSDPSLGFEDSAGTNGHREAGADHKARRLEGGAHCVPDSGSRLASSFCVRACVLGAGCWVLGAER